MTASRTKTEEAGQLGRDHEATLMIGRGAALLALLALLTGGTLMAATGPLLAGAPEQDAFAPIREHSGLFWSAALALALISLFDLFTIPALHQVLRPQGPGVILIATITAAVGDVLGILGRLLQASGVAAVVSRTGSPELLGVMEQVFNTSGFILVAVSFASFGVLMLRGTSRWLGWTGLAAGVCTVIGQVPGLDAVFALANLAFLSWYIGLARVLRPART